ncbi:MAG TPA: NUDIX domain-containing protein [Candidatus Paceibacterota bacterium]
MIDSEIEVQLSGCAIIKDNKLLLLKKFKNSYYEFPGGKLDENETIEEAAIREAKEEIGCDIKIITNFGFFDFIHKEKNVRSNIFLAETADEPTIVETEIFENMIWIPLDKYLDYDLASNVLYFCENH